MKQKAKLKCYKKAGPVSENPLYKSNADYAYQAWRKSLPDNLSQESRGYNLRGAWEAGNEMSFEPDGAFHLSSRNPDTGEILKSPEHHTYDMAIEGDIKVGYGPRIDARTGKIYTINPNDPATAGPFKKKTGGLMFRLKTGGAIPDIKDTSHFPPVSASENDLTLNFGNWAKGGLLKRADGSYSKRGLWDNIRANKGSDNKPTKAMLKQEKKIRAQEKADGGTVDNGFTNTTPAVGRYANGNVIYTQNPNDPRLKAYNDSLSLSKKYPIPQSGAWGLDTFKTSDVYKKDIDNATKNNKGIAPIGFNPNQVNNNNRHQLVYAKPKIEVKLAEQPKVETQPVTTQPVQNTTPVETSVQTTPKDSISYEPETTNLGGGKGQYVHYDSQGNAHVITEQEYGRLEGKVKHYNPTFKKGGAIKYGEGNVIKNIDLKIPQYKQPNKPLFENQMFAVPLPTMQNSFVAGERPSVNINNDLNTGLEFTKVHIPGVKIPMQYGINANYQVNPNLNISGAIRNNGFNLGIVKKFAGGGGIEYADSKFWEDRPIQKRLKAPGYKQGGKIKFKASLQYKKK